MFPSFILPLSLAFAYASAQWIDNTQPGFATMTHYGDLSSSVVAACGCKAASANYPTAAMSQMAFGSSMAFGPACGKCFNLTLLNTFVSEPPWVLSPEQTKSVVVKITDLCPLSADGWCSGKNDKVNAGGHNINFDLAYPSVALPDDFYPTNASFYGYEDFGVWNISYAPVSCETSWTGYSDQAILGKVPELGDEGSCCPGNPTLEGNDTCVSYSDRNNLSPDSLSGAPATLVRAPWTTVMALVAVVSMCTLL